MKGVFVPIVVASMLVGGCASNQLSVTYYSDPPAATLLGLDGKSFGQAPLTLYYNIDDATRASGRMVLQGMTAQWVSGAKVTFNSLTADFANGTQQNFTFHRPRAVSGLAIDMNYALEVEKLNEMKRQTALAQQARWDAERAARNAEEAAEKARKKTYTCDRLGTLVHCH